MGALLSIVLKLNGADRLIDLFRLLLVVVIHRLRETAGK